VTDREAADLYRTDRAAWKVWKAAQADEADRRRDAVFAEICDRMRMLHVEDIEDEVD